jgi:hypothetical protein
VSNGSDNAADANPRAAAATDRTSVAVVRGFASAALGDRASVAARSTHAAHRERKSIALRAVRTIAQRERKR